MPDRVVLLSVPQLRQRDVTPGALASLEALVARGGMTEFLPAFPSLAAASFATLVTGTLPGDHGLIGDAYFDRDAGHVVTRPFPDALIKGPKLWERLKARRPDAKALAWFTPNLQGAHIDLAAWVGEESGLATQPANLADSLERSFGPYPAPRALPAGEPLPIAATAWMLRTASHLINQEGPDLSILRVPYLGQVARRYGPDGREACRAVIELERILSTFLASLPRSTVVLVATESVATPVIAPFHPNLVLRDLGLLEFTSAEGGGLDIDLQRSAAFALTDHQLCHIYLNDPSVAATVAAAFSSASQDAIDTVASGQRRARLGLNHPHAGDVVLVACPDCWFAPNWWQRRHERPANLASGSRLALGGDFDPSKVRGSHGALPPSSEYHGVAIASKPGLLPDLAPIAIGDLAGLIGRLLGLDR